jgi:hypothetical protein
VRSAVPPSAWRRWVRQPFAVLEAVRHARTWHPVPLFYAVVGAIALVPALVLVVLTRVRWWAALLGVPVAAMVGSFLWSMATAVGRRREVLWRLAPDRAQAEELEEELVSLGEQIGEVPLLVPEGWSGALSLDGAHWSIPPRGPRVLEGVTVIADQGDPLVDDGWRAFGRPPATPRVEVRFSRLLWDVAEDQALRELVERAHPADPAEFDGAERADKADQADQAERAEQLADGWRDGSVQADGAAVPARLLTSEDTGVEVATFHRGGWGVLLIAEGTDLDTITLAGVADPAPLVREFERRRRRALGPEPG